MNGWMLPPRLEARSPDISNVQFWAPSTMCEFCWLIAFLCRIIADFFHTFAHIIGADCSSLEGREGDRFGWGGVCLSLDKAHKSSGAAAEPRNLCLVAFLMPGTQKRGLFKCPPSGLGR